jgi:hypothetical protein
MQDLNDFSSIRVGSEIYRNHEPLHDGVGYMNSLIGFKFKVVENNPDEGVIKALWLKDSEDGVYSKRHLPIEKRFLNSKFFEILN